MNRRADLRSFIACAVAYAIAIQAALFGLTIAATGSTSTILCSGKVQADGPLAPPNQGHGTDVLCCVATGCGVSAGPPTDRALAPPTPVFAATRDISFVPSDEFTGWPNERPKSSRAPPI